ncbi:IS3 family transposase [Halosquirtibacter laminarini]|uniref:IS3 family transposase n=1 Tax=Halosquirtibacter laminarini TaxID=3374600 RepID=A0AC61NDI8_9BACT|nr:IS3 family transposase [Prolixibacteraceae bacterium]
MSDNSTMFSVKSMCKTLDISSSAYYEWKKDIPFQRNIAWEKDTKLVLKEYKESKRRYGSNKITAVLDQNGVTTSRNRVARIMKQMV